MTEPGRPAGGTHWPAYYEVTADRPAWETTRVAIARFAEEDAVAAAAGGPPRAEPRLALDLGCGAGRDTRELLRHGWRVVAVDREPQAIVRLRAVTPASDLARLSTSVEDIGEALVAPCDLVNANLSLPFLDAAGWAHAWAQIRGAVRPGGRIATMLFGDRDAKFSPEMTCPPEAEIRALLDVFEIELWAELEEDGTTALGEPHHFHRFDIVARRPGGSARRGPKPPTRPPTPPPTRPRGTPRG